MKIGKPWTKTFSKYWDLTLGAITQSKMLRYFDYLGKYGAEFDLSLLAGKRSAFNVDLPLLAG